MYLMYVCILYFFKSRDRIIAGSAEVVVYHHQRQLLRVPELFAAQVAAAFDALKRFKNHISPWVPVGIFFFASGLVLLNSFSKIRTNS